MDKRLILPLYHVLCSLCNLPAHGWQYSLVSKTRYPTRPSVLWGPPHSLHPPCGTRPTAGAGGGGVGGGGVDGGGGSVQSGPEMQIDNIK